MLQNFEKITKSMFYFEKVNAFCLFNLIVKQGLKNSPFINPYIRLSKEWMRERESMFCFKKVNAFCSFNLILKQGFKNSPFINSYIRLSKEWMREREKYLNQHT